MPLFDELRLERSAPLCELLNYLQCHDYSFVTPTPRTHATVLARDPQQLARTPGEVLGWSMAFRERGIDPELERLLSAADALTHDGELRRATVRVSSLRDRLYLHTAYPTSQADAVFFGPDSYRFADLVAGSLEHWRSRAPVIVDVGTGAGVGAIVAADKVPAATIVMTDVNASALALAGVNARTANVKASYYLGDIFGDYDGPVDVALANPPYIVDADKRQYRDGGEEHGAALSIRMASEIVPRLSAGGRFILYTGSAIVHGEDRLLQALASLADRQGAALSYREIDPDVFGEELESPAYADVDRIAVVAAIFDKPS